MKSKKLGLLILLLSLAVGFAAVTTNLILNGNTKIGMGDFNVYFSEASSETGDTILLSSDKKSITFETQTLDNLDDYSEMLFTVYNDSNDYSANVSFDYNIGSNLSMEEILKYVDLGIMSYDEEENNYVPFNQGETFILGAKEYKRFILYVEVHNLPLEDFSFTTNLTFNATPIESGEPYYNEAIGLYETMGYNNLEPGLYDTELNMTKSWNQLIDENIIYVNDGVLSSNYNYDDEFYIPPIGHDGNTIERIGISHIVTGLNEMLGFSNMPFSSYNDYYDFFDSHNTSCSNLNGILVIDDSIESTLNYNFICSGLKGVIFKHADYLTYDKNYMGFANIKVFNIPIDNVKPTYNSGGQYYVTANKVIDGDYVYADASKTSLVAYIGDSTNIVIPEGVTDIGPSTFAYNHIDNITWPSTYKVIQIYDFAGATIDNLVIPSSIEELGDGSLSGLDYNDITLSEGLKKIGNSVFRYNKDLPITIPDSVVEIGESAFSGVKNIFINWSGEYPENQWGATYINPYTQGDFLLGNVGSIILYKYNGNSTSIAIPNEVKIIQSYALYSNDKYEEYTNNNKNITTIEFPSSLLTIRKFAFSGLKNLVNPIIPNSVTTIGEKAFGDIKNIIYNGPSTYESNDQYWGAKYINGYLQGDIVYEDDSLKTIVKYAGDSKSVVIPNGAERVKKDAFRSQKITNVVLPDTLKYIEECGFGYNNISSIELPDGLLEIGKEAFTNNRIKYIDIPTSVTAIGNNAFLSSYVVNLPTTIPTMYNYSLSGNYVMYHGSNTFKYYNYGAKALNPYVEDDFIYKDNTKKYLYTYMMDKNTVSDGFTLTIPDGVETIGYEAFRFRSVKKVIMPDTVTKIEGSAFWGSGLREVRLSNNLQEIGNCAFYDHYLSEVIIPESVRVIVSSAFSTYDSVNTKVYLPSNSLWGYSEFGKIGQITNIDSSISNDPVEIGKWMTNTNSGYNYERRY